MKKRMSLLLLAVFVTPGIASGKMLTTKELSDACTDYEKVVANGIQPQSAVEAINFGKCLGYFEGFMDALAVSGKYTAEGDTSLSVQNMELAFRLYVNKHPEKMDEESALSVIFSLRDANLIKVR